MGRFDEFFVHRRYKVRIGYFHIYNIINEIDGIIIVAFLVQGSLSVEWLWFALRFLLRQCSVSVDLG